MNRTGNMFARRASRRSSAGGLPILAAWCACCFGAAPALAQQKTYKVDEDGQWVVSKAPEPGSDAEVIGRAREMTAQGRHAAAEALMDAWIERNERTSNPWLAEAYLARGDARLMRDREVPALEDYEEIIKNFPGSEAYVIALTRELDIGLQYLNGKRKKFFGLRIEPAERVGEEIVLRVSERLPRSRLAERALMDLADYYYRVRDMKMAAEAYDVFLKLFPNSEQRQRAMQRRVYANIAKFKGPLYDASGLREAKFLIENYKARYPQDAERIGMDDALIARLDESAAAQLLETAKWYLRRGDEVSARLTITRLLRRHPGTVAVVRAQEMVQEHGWKLPEPKPAVVDEPATEPENTPAEETPEGPPATDTAKPKPEPDQGSGR